MSVGDWLSENILGNDKRYPGARTKAGNSVVEEGLNALSGAIQSGLGIAPENNFLTGPYGFTKQPRKYYLEIRKGEKILTVTGFPYDPQAMTVERPHPISVTHTYGGVVREASTIRMHRVTFSGRSGTAIRNGFNRDGYAIFRTGQVIFLEFDDFLKRYNELCNTDFGTKNIMTTNYADLKTQSDKRDSKKLSTSEEVQMILRCLDDDLHLRVEPVTFQYSRNAQSARHDYQYTLVLEAYDYAYDTKPFNPVASLDALVNNTIGQVTGAIALADNAIRRTDEYGTKLKGVVNSIQNPIGALDALGKSTDQLKYTYAQLATALEELPKAYFGSESRQSQTQNGPVNVEVVWHHENSSIEPPPASSESEEITQSYNQALMNQLINSILIGRGAVSLDLIRSLRLRLQGYSLGEYLSNERNLTLLSGDVADLGDPSNIPEDSIPYLVQRNEDLKKISKKFFGTHDLWPLIAELNGMPDSRRKADGGILDAGDRIYIPFDGIQGFNQFNRQGDIFSVDISMPYDDLEIISQDVNDFELISGVENLKQAVKNKLLTFKGEMPNYENVGLPRLTFVNDVDYTAAQIREVLIRDPRIAEIKNIVALVEEDVVRISCQVLALTGESFNVKV